MSCVKILYIKAQIIIGDNSLKDAHVPRIGLRPYHIGQLGCTIPKTYISR